LGERTEVEVLDTKTLGNQLNILFGSRNLNLREFNNIRFNQGGNVETR
jgi:hypothetical protein